MTISFQFCDQRFHHGRFHQSIKYILCDCYCCYQWNSCEAKTPHMGGVGIDLEQAGDFSLILEERLFRIFSLQTSTITALKNMPAYVQLIASSEGIMLACKSVSQLLDGKTMGDFCKNFAKFFFKKCKNVGLFLIFFLFFPP